MGDPAQIVEQGTPTGHGKLQWRILIGFALGLAGGLAAYSFAGGAGWVDTVTTYVTGPIGQIFLRLLFMLVIPLLFSALVVGIAEMGEIRSLKTVGIRTLVYTVVVSAIAVMVSLATVNILQPGAGVDRHFMWRPDGERGRRASDLLSSPARDGEPPGARAWRAEQLP